MGVHPLALRFEKLNKSNYAAARPMRKMSDIAPRALQNAQVIAAADLSGPKNWAGRLVTRPVFKDADEPVPVITAVSSFGNVKAKVQAFGQRAKSAPASSAAVVDADTLIIKPNISNVAAAALHSCMSSSALFEGGMVSSTASGLAAARLLRPNSTAGLGDWRSKRTARSSLNMADFSIMNNSPAPPPEPRSYLTAQGSPNASANFSTVNAVMDSVGGSILRPVTSQGKEEGGPLRRSSTGSP